MRTRFFMRSEKLSYKQKKLIKPGDREVLK